MSKQDTHFFNVFSLVIGLLVAVAIGLFALARIVASHTQDRQVLQVCSKSSVPFFGIAASALPAPAGPGALMASAELSCPAIASWLGGAMRTATFLA